MMDSTPLVSLLMLVFNNVQYLKAAITSAQLQTYRNWELIIVDDGSVDGALELVQKLAESDARIKVYRNKERLGIVKNRARAYSLSTGEFVGHFDSDDRLERYAIEEMMIAFHMNPQQMLIHSDYAHIDSSGKLISYATTEDYEHRSAKSLGWRHFGVYKREVMSHIAGYNTKLISACEDGDLMAQISYKFGHLRLPKVLYYHRVHDNNSQKDNKKCESCSERPVCNFIRVWSDYVGYDPITFTKLPEKDDGENSVPSAS